MLQIFYHRDYSHELLKQRTNLYDAGHENCENFMLQTCWPIPWQRCAQKHLEKYNVTPGCILHPFNKHLSNFVSSGIGNWALMNHFVRDSISHTSSGKL